MLTSVKLTLSQSSVVLHQGALVALMDFASTLTAQIEQVKRENSVVEVAEGPEAPASAGTRALRRKLSQILEDDAPRIKKKIIKRE